MMLWHFVGFVVVFFLGAMFGVGALVVALNRGPNVHRRASDGK